MKNRAKCKLCNSVIESFHSTDCVTCKCGEIFVDGGEAMLCGSNNWDNFLRVDENGNEIIVKVVNENHSSEQPPSKPTKQELIVIIKDLISTIEKLPNHAMQEPITHYDYCSLLTLLVSVLEVD